MRMTRDERERKFRSAQYSSNLDRVWDFIRELMADLNAADSDIAQAQRAPSPAGEREPRLHIDLERLKERIARDPDLPVEAGAGEREPGGIVAGQSDIALAHSCFVGQSVQPSPVAGEGLRHCDFCSMPERFTPADERGMHQSKLTSSYFSCPFALRSASPAPPDWCSCEKPLICNCGKGEPHCEECAKPLSGATVSRIIYQAGASPVAEGPNGKD